MPADPYVYPGTTCLRNRLGIHDAVELERAEAARTSVAIAKDDSLFALPQHLDTYLNSLFNELASEAFLRDLNRERCLERLTHNYAELNAAHPFREGNGRTQRAFLGQLARDAGYRLAWQRLDRDRNIDAARAGHRGDNVQLREMLAELLEPLV